MISSSKINDPRACRRVVQFDLIHYVQFGTEGRRGLDGRDGLVMTCQGRHTPTQTAPALQRRSRGRLASGPKQKFIPCVDAPGPAAAARVQTE
jgi:hypothetical protein